MSVIIATSSKTSPAKMPPISTAQFLSVMFPKIVLEDVHVVVTTTLSVVTMPYVSLVVMMSSGLSVMMLSSGLSVVMMSSAPLVGVVESDIVIFVGTMN